MLQLSAAELKDLSNVQLDALADFILTFSKDDPIFPAPLVESEDEDVSDEQLAEVAFASNSIRKIPDSPDTRHAVAEIPSNDRLDIHGLPWDERIHASSHAKTADGSWRAKRNVEPSLVATVEAELKALMAIPAARGTYSGAVTIGDTIIGVIADPPRSVNLISEMSAQVPPAPPVAAATPAPVAAPPPPPPPAVDPNRAFIDFIQWASQLIGANKLTKEEIASIVVSHGMTKLPDLDSRRDLIPQVRQSIEALMLTR